VTDDPPLRNATILARRTSIFTREAISVTRNLPRQLRTGIRRTTVAAAVLLALGLGASSSLPAKAQPSGATARAFATAYIRPAPRDEQLSGFSMSPTGRFTATATTVQDLVLYAYEEKAISGPTWMTEQRFDIDARLDDSLAALWQKLPTASRDQQTRHLVRALLEDRFKLHATRQTQQVPVYALVVANDGPKLLPSPNAKPVSHLAGIGPHITPGYHELTVKRATMDSWADQLADQPDIDRLVINQTGLTGIYDFTLLWSPSKDGSGPTLFQAIESQLGLKLKSTTGPIDTLVIDHLERATEN
jgi:uncharacterized protein (TIGR03435 family)